jgi:hypothetical protein
VSRVPSRHRLCREGLGLCQEHRTLGKAIESGSVPTSAPCQNPPCTRSEKSLCVDRPSRARRCWSFLLLALRLLGRYGAPLYGGQCRLELVF